MENANNQSIYARKPWLQRYDYWVPAEVTFPTQSIYHTLNLAATLYPDQPATAFLGIKVTFKEVKQQADKLAMALTKLGIGKGDRVGVMLPNCPQYIISFFAITRLGAIVVNINPIYTAREVEFVAKDSGMRAIIVLDMLAPVVLGVLAQTSIENVITTSVLAYSGNPTSAPAAPEGTLSFSELIAAVAKPVLPRVEIDAKEDIAALVYTGGTTGLPKGAMLTHYNLFAATVMCELWGGPYVKRGEGAFLLVIPYFHIYGLVVGCIYATHIGAMQIPIPKFDPNLLLDAIKNYQPTFFPGVPTLFISLINNPAAVNSGLDRVHRFNSGSAPLPVEVIEQFEAMSGAALLEGYGMTETSAITTSTALLAQRKPGSIGFPMTSTECKIVDLETGKSEMPVGSEGELCIRGPQIMKGYWNKPEETANTLREGWLYTGDIARMDEEGYLYIVQRKKDMIIVSGFNVYPTEIEDVLFTHPALQECAVIGVPDKYRGESVKAFLVLKPGTQATAEEIIEFCGDKLAKYKIPTFIEFMTALPKSAVGKVLRRELREMEEKK
jgi:long-chain acyl-CoA synthetase